MSRRFRWRFYAELDWAIWGLGVLWDYDELTVWIGPLALAVYRQRVQRPATQTEGSGT